MYIDKHENSASLFWLVWQCKAQGFPATQHMVIYINNTHIITPYQGAPYVVFTLAIALPSSADQSTH